MIDRASRIVNGCRLTAQASALSSKLSKISHRDCYEADGDIDTKIATTSSD